MASFFPKRFDHERFRPERLDHDATRFSISDE
jgi:hypothetical protein